jgi:hypothetical protein
LIWSKSLKQIFHFQYQVIPIHVGKIEIAIKGNHLAPPAAVAMIGTVVTLGNFFAGVSDDSRASPMD